MSLTPHGLLSTHPLFFVNCESISLFSTMTLARSFSRIYNLEKKAQHETSNLLLICPWGEHGRIAA